MKFKKTLLTLSMVSLIGMVLMVSGCISTDTESENSEDLEFSIVPYVDYYEDGSGGIWSEIENTGTNTYRHIDIEIIGYNKNHEKVFTDTKGFAVLKPGEYASIFRELGENDPKNIHSVEMKVVNKTRE